MEIKVELSIKPLTVNRSWRGRRYKTRDYLDYEKDLLYILPNQETIAGKLSVKLEFYLKYCKQSDCDNFIKPLLDVLQKKGYFENDNQIYHIEAEKFESVEDRVNIFIREHEG